jgi:PAS domain S-box-containing protein
METDCKSAFNARPDLMWITSADGYIDFANLRGCECTGLSMSEGSNDRARKVMHPDDLATVHTFWQRFVDSDGECETAARVRRRDGACRLFGLQISPVHNGAGEIPQWCGLHTEIEDYKYARMASVVESFRLAVDIEHEGRSP